MIRFYGYKKCSTCRKAENQLEKMKKKYQFIDITLDPPKASELKSLIKESQLEMKKFFNTSGELYREMNMKEKMGTMSLDEASKLLAQNGKLIKRPLVIDGTKLTVGFNETEFAEKWR